MSFHLLTKSTVFPHPIWNACVPWVQCMRPAGRCGIIYCHQTLPSGTCQQALGKKKRWDKTLPLPWRGLWLNWDTQWCLSLVQNLICSTVLGKMVVVLHPTWSSQKEVKFHQTLLVMNQIVYKTHWGTTAWVRPQGSVGGRVGSYGAVSKWTWCYLRGSEVLHRSGLQTESLRIQLPGREEWMNSWQGNKIAPAQNGNCRVWYSFVCTV